MVKKVRIVNLGCSKNQVDSENILGEFGRAGYRLALEGESPEVTVINTCGFIEAAKEESIGEIFERVQGRGEGERIIVAGCLSQRYGEELKRDIPEIDLLVGTYRNGEILERLGLNSTKPSDCEIGASPRTLMGEEPHHAFLKIAEGCNRICGFCAIPGMRGKQKSRRIADLVKEAQELQTYGIREISLIAQDLTYFGREKNGRETLSELLQALIRETDISWFRLMYAYPAFVDEELVGLMANEKRICKYLDIPIQHASDAMLRSMRRNYGHGDLQKIFSRLREAMPDLSLRTTVLLGYPGETEADVDELLQFMEEVRFKHLGGFTYSDEDGTHAYDLPGKIESEVMEKRLERVMTLQQEISLEENLKKIGKTLRVVVDGVAEGQDYLYVGRTEGDAPEVDNRVLIYSNPSDGLFDADPGSFRDVLVTDALEYDLEAILLPPNP